MSSGALKGKMMKKLIKDSISMIIFLICLWAFALSILAIFFSLLAHCYIITLIAIIIACVSSYLLGTIIIRN